MRAPDWFLARPADYVNAARRPVPPRLECSRDWNTILVVSCRPSNRMTAFG